MFAGMPTRAILAGGLGLCGVRICVPCHTPPQTLLNCEFNIVHSGATIRSMQKRGSHPTRGALELGLGRGLAWG
eukprot:11933984-Heterocapsa_arctica.AAC.1